MLVISGYTSQFHPHSPILENLSKGFPVTSTVLKVLGTEMDEIPQPTSQVSEIAETTETATEATASCRVGEQGGTGHRGGR
jgi:hypothetical protein